MQRWENMVQKQIQKEAEKKKWDNKNKGDQIKGR